MNEKGIALPNLMETNVYAVKGRVLIVGAGLIGLKCAEGILHRAKEVTVCDLADRVLSSILDDESAKIVQTHLESHGIRFLLGDSAVSFSGTGAKMKSGKEQKQAVLTAETPPLRWTA